MEARDIEDIYELSPVQQGIFFHSFSAQESGVYCIQLRLRLRGRLDVMVFKRAWQQAVNRHTALRTSFHCEDVNKPLQVVRHQVDLAMAEYDWRGLSATERQARLADYLETDRRRGFDLKEPPLMRLALFQTADDEREFLWSHHHLILDGWATSLLLKEIFTSYEASTNGQRLNQAPARPYSYYIAWLQRQDISRAEGFWRELLKGVTAPTQLRIEPAVSAFTDGPRESSRTELKFSAAMTAELQAFARRNHLTTNTIVQGAWALLLSRYSGEPDVVFGAVVSDRAAELSDAELIVGPLINTLPMRVRVNPQTTAVAWLKEMQAQQAQMQNYSSTPLTQIQGWSDVPRGLPLFETIFAFENYPIDRSSQNRGKRLEITDVGHSSNTNYALAVVVLTGPELVLRSTYDKCRFPPDSIQRMLRHLETLVKGMLAEGERPLAGRSMLTDVEREQLIVDWNRTKADIPSNRRIDNLFEEQVKRTPSAVAVVDGERHLTYLELNWRANRLAHYLRRLGVGPDVIVGICVDRCTEMVVGLLGALKAGGAYLPLDPDYPIERLRFMLQDTALPIVLTLERLARSLPARWEQLINLDTDWETIGQESEEAPSLQPTPEGLAYVIYTSGSTGAPKGVQITHANVTSLLASAHGHFGFDAQDVWTQFHSYAFDFSVWEIWGALLYGGRLVITPYRVSRDPESFYELLEREGVTVLNQTPSAFGRLIEAVAGAPTRRALCLRYVIFGGEMLEYSSLRAWYAMCGPVPLLVNMYGITETTVHVTCHRINVAEAEINGGSLIGRGINGWRVYILDAEMEPAPVGIKGELYVGGRGLARGYLNRPDLTTERFVPDAVSGRAGEMLYRTGDLGRWREDGNIEFLGRADRQVKIRGFRIELGEIEAALSKHSAVREAVVTARNDSTDSKRLVAYLTPRPEAAPNASDLRDFLLTKLPGYMVPATFVVLKALPLTPNGKIDLRALPELEGTRPNLREASILPRTELEIFLADCWREVIGVDGIGVRDNFFELGGDSIKAAVFANRLQERLGEIVHVVAVFDAPTIAELVNYLYRHNHQGVSKIFGAKTLEKYGADESQPLPAQVAAIDTTSVARMRELITPLSPPAQTGPAVKTKNPPAIFILSAPRSGSTLFRVMLGGSPDLFAPPELELLSYNTLGERKNGFSGRDSFWLEGTIRAIMEIKNCGAGEASRIMQEYEERNISTRDFYYLLQDWIGEKRLVDKTPAYALDLEILKRAEAWFDDALYIHLLRHPRGMIRSFEEASLDQILSRYKHPFSTRQFAELAWIISQQNILNFLIEVPSHRQHRVRFEDLVNEPQRTLEEVCRFLNVDLHPDMLQPYKDKERRMTDGIHATSRMLGDVKFHGHKKIDAKVATSWKAYDDVVPLGEITWEVAESFDYQRTESDPGTHRRSSSVSLTPIRLIKRNEQTELPLSFAQQRLWLLDQLEPGSLSYNCGGAARLSGKIDLDALRQSLNQIVQRHEALRTTFQSIDGRPRQMISHPHTLSLPMVDLSTMPIAQREEKATQIIRDEAARPFDLSRGPLMRVAILKLAEDEHALMVNMHHIVSDGWSIGVFIREMMVLYQACVAGQPSLLPPPPIQYADFAGWQREWLQGPVLEKQIQYWKEQLAGAPAILELPVERPRVAGQNYRPARQTAVLSAELATELKALAQAEGATLFMVLLAAFKTLLWRWSGQPDVVVGTPIAGRNREEIEGLIGFFVNTLALRTKVDGEQSFRALVRQVREVCLEAYAHQEAPFEKLVEELQPERSLSRTPLFQVFFNLLNARDNEFEIPGLVVKAVENEVPASKFDITLYAREQQSELHLESVCNAYLFSERRVAEMMSQMILLLTQTAQNPEQALAAYSLVTPQAEAALLQPFQPLCAEWEESVQIRFARQARLHPEQVALIDSHGKWSYAELDAHSTRLANYLRAGGICPNEVVAVYAHRSASLVWALLGILKAGAAFLILDPAYPPNRLTECLNIANAQGWIQLEAAGELPNRLEHFLETSAYHCRLSLPRSPDTVFLEDYAIDCPDNVTIGPDDLAYVAFTSGSTGKPNGILGNHGPLSHFFRWYSQAFGLRDSDRFSMLSGLAHDPLLRDIFTPLWLGGTLCIPDQEDLTSPRKLTDWAQREAITIVHLTPAMARLIAGVDNNTAGVANVSGPVLPSLRYAFFGGDLLTRRDVLITRRLAKSLTCVNFYGATETPQAIAYHTVDPGQEEAGIDALNIGAEPIPIGMGITDVQLLVLNALQQLAGIGELGEIYVRTPYLSKGYLGDESLTASRFITNPLTKMGGDCLYRTGDRGRYLPDGAVMFVGRIDQQVKIRGFRIELGEVEAALGQYEAVQMAAVKVCADASGDKRLVAYIVPRTGLAPTVNELRDLLRERLPDYMTPSAVVLLDRMPLTPNGKINREALPEPDWTLPSLSKGFVAPRTPVEKKLVEIWTAILGVERAGIHDNFFDLGGHSLLATQIVSRIRKAFDIEVPLRALFQAPTIAELAIVVTQMQVDLEADEDLAQIMMEIKYLTDGASNQMFAEEL